MLPVKGEITGRGEGLITVINPARASPWRESTTVTRARCQGREARRRAARPLGDANLLK